MDTILIIYLIVCLLKIKSSWEIIQESLPFVIETIPPEYVKVVTYFAYFFMVLFSPVTTVLGFIITVIEFFKKLFKK
jgi:TRAP-type C4-dicarboxylate transport system permease small subunit